MSQPSLNEFASPDYIGIDPTVQAEIQASVDAEEEARKRAQQAQQRQQQEQEAAVKAQETAGKSSHETKDPKEFGLGENLQELGNAAIGGFTDAANSVVTAPQRLFDPKAWEPGNTEYKPPWVPFGENNSPVTRTVWGGILRGAIEFGGLAVATKLTAGAAAAGFAGKIDKASKAANWLAKGPQLTKATSVSGKAANFVRAKGHDAVVGGIADTVSLRSTESNLAAELIKIKPEWEDSLKLFATNDDMSPNQRSMMNTLEGNGLGTIAGGVMDVLGAGWRSLRGGKATPTPKGGSTVTPEPSPEAIRAQQIDTGARAEADANFQADPENVKPWDQLTPEEQESARAAYAARNKIPYENTPEYRRALREENEIEVGIGRIARDPEGANGFDPYINQGAEFNQGRTLNSIPDLEGAIRDTTVIRSDWTQAQGTPRSILSESLLDDIDASPIGGRTEMMDLMLEQMQNTPEFRDALKNGRITRAEVQNLRQEALDTYVNAFGNRPLSSIPEEEIEQFVGPLTPGRDGNVGLDMPNLIRNDLVISVLSKEAQDIASGALTLVDAVDVAAKDAQVDMILRRFKPAVVKAKMSTYERSVGLSNLKSLRDPEKAASDSAVKMAEFEAEADAVANLIKQAIDSDDSDATLKAVLAAISMGDGSVRSLMDVDRVFRKSMYGPGVSGGKLIKELMSTMTHSVLSSTVTPVRAALGTAFNVYMRPAATALGALVKGDLRIARSAMAEMGALNEAMGDAFKLFKARTKANFTGVYTPDVGTQARFYLESPADLEIAQLGEWVQTRGNFADKAVFFAIERLHDMNKLPLLTGGVRVMEAADVGFQQLIGRARLRSIAFNKAMDEIQAKNLVIDAKAEKELVLRMEDEYRSMVFNPDGTLKDEMAQYAAKEATMTLDMPKWAEAVDQTARAMPWLRPFMLFPQTRWNSIELLLKSTPLLNNTIREVRDIKNLPFDHPDLIKYGIKTPEEHMAAKAMIRGREAMGFGTVALAASLYWAGGLTGNGPRDPELRRTWTNQYGWRPRSIKIGDRWVSYDTFEPFNTILSSVGDILDSQKEMGEKETENWLGRVAYVISGALQDKTFFTGFADLTDLLSSVSRGEDKALGRFAGGLANNLIPLSSLRNQIGKVLVPGMREVDEGFMSSIQRRNPYLFPDLPYMTDVITGQKVNMADPATRMFNAFSPIQMNLDASPVKQTLQRSLFNTRMSLETVPGGGEVVDPQLKAKYQHFIGQEGVGRQLEQLFKRPDVIASIRQMESDRASGRASNPPEMYPHNRLIDNIFERAKRVAWTKVQSDPEAQRLIQDKNLQKLRNQNIKSGEFQRANQIQQLRDFAQ